MENLEKEIKKLESMLDSKGYQPLWEYLGEEPSSSLIDLFRGADIKSRTKDGHSIELYGSPVKYEDQESMPETNFYDYELRVRYQPDCGFKVIMLDMERKPDSLEFDARCYINNRNDEIYLPSYQSICKALDDLLPSEESVMVNYKKDTDQYLPILTLLSKMSLEELYQQSKTITRLLGKKGFDGPFYHQGLTSENLFRLLLNAGSNATESKTFADGFIFKPAANKQDMYTTVNYEVGLKQEVNNLIGLNTFTAFNYHVTRGVTKISIRPKSMESLPSRQSIAKAVSNLYKKQNKKNKSQGL